MVPSATCAAGASRSEIPLGATTDAPLPATNRSRKRKPVEGEKSARKKRKGRLSVLPTLPLDILYEIFAHLRPGDLLHLARTTQSFRSILMTRKATFIWKEVLDVSAKDGDPARPADMSEPQWTALVFGRPWCTECGARTSSSIIWMLRVRLCAKCLAEQLGVLHFGTSTLRHRDFSVPLYNLLPTEAVNYPSSSRKSTRIETVVTSRDLESYKNALDSLREKHLDNTLFAEQRKLLNERMMAALHTRREHAVKCSIIETDRAESRGNELTNIRNARYADIRRRLLGLGYEIRDIEHRDIQQHKDVWTPRPLTDKVWDNIQLSVRKCVDEIHAQRINAEIAHRRQEREDVVSRAYLDFLRTAGYRALPFAPSLGNLLQMPLISDAISTDVAVSDDMLVTIKAALVSSELDIISWMRRRAKQLRDLVPNDWPRKPEAVPDCSDRPNANLTSFAPGEAFRGLDLVAYTWNYPLGNSSASSTGVVYGLAAIAQQNEKQDVLGVKPAAQDHLIIMQLLALLDLDPAQTTVPQMHRIADSELFVCESCVCKTSTLQPPPSAVPLKSWTSAVAHARICPCKPSPEFRLISPLERRYVSAYRKLHPPTDKALYGKRSHWGCCHCDVHLNQSKRHQWYSDRHSHSTGPWCTLPSVKAHLAETHGILHGTEDEDFFWNRQWPCSVNTYGAFVPASGLLEATEKLEGEVQ